MQLSHSKTLSVKTNLFCGDRFRSGSQIGIDRLMGPGETEREREKERKGGKGRDREIGQPFF